VPRPVRRAVECSQPEQMPRRGRWTSWPSTGSPAVTTRGYHRSRRHAPSCPRLARGIARIASSRAVRVSVFRRPLLPRPGRSSIREAGKYYEENLENFGPRRLVRALTDELTTS